MSERIPDRRDECEPQDAAQNPTPGEPTVLLRASQQAQSHSETRGEQKLRHDRIGVAAVVVRVLEDPRTGGITSQELTSSMPSIV